MLAKFTNVLFAVIATLLLVVVIGLMIKITNLEKENYKLLKEKGEQAVVIAEKTIELNNKVVEVVHVPSVKYEEKIIHAKPVIEYVTKEAVKIVNNPVYLNVCFDDPGLQLTNDLIELGRPIDTGITSEPEQSLPEAE